MECSDIDFRAVAPKRKRSLTCLWYQAREVPASGRAKKMQKIGR